MTLSNSESDSHLAWTAFFSEVRRLNRLIKQREAAVNAGVMLKTELVESRKEERTTAQTRKKPSRQRELF